MATKPINRPITVEERAAVAENLQLAAENLHTAERSYIRRIVAAHDVWGLTFREISGYIGCSVSWAFKLYKRGKA